MPRFAAQVDKLRFKGFIINGYINRVLDNGGLLLSLWLLITFMKDTLAEVIVKNRGAAVLRT